jgi:multiple antibiotic resistance protein
MEQFLKNLLLAFIPVFVAVDAVGALPVFVSLTEDLTRAEKKRVLLQSMITAFCLALGFILLGKVLFRFLGITIGDFMVAGGTILFSIAIIDIASPVKRQRMPGDIPGVVPLGTPLIAGPALLTTSLLMIGEYGILPTLISVTVNIVIAGLIFYSSSFLTRIFGDAGSKALSKIISLFLAAIAVMMIRKGILLMTAAS